MRCRKCDYRLWNLASRRCPECGEPFLPSQYEFIINSIQFCCPHCHQAYYGTGEKGHLIPVAFTCVGCGRSVHMDEMILLPTAGVEEEQTRPDPMPWLERKQFGAVKAWFATVGRALTRPGRLIRAMPQTGHTGDAWWFAIVTSFIVLLATVTPFVLLPMIIAGAVGSGGVGLSAIGGGVVGSLVAVVCFVIFLAIWGATIHGCLRLTGPITGTIERTYQALGFSSGANVVSAVPCLGYYFGWIWWLVSAIIMVKEGQGVHAWRAVLSVLVLPVLGFFALAALYAAVIASALTGAGPFGGAFSPAGQETELVVEALHQFAEDHDGNGPTHAIELVAGDYLATVELVATLSNTTEADVPVGGVTLAKYATLTDGERQRIAQTAVATMPGNVIAHRLGDFVFVHHGIDLSDCDGRMWVVILSRDPQVGQGRRIAKRIVAGRCDGTAVQIGASSLGQRLAEQNALRATYGLQPLPDPVTVTHAQPAVAAEGAPESDVEQH